MPLTDPNEVLGQWLFVVVVVGGLVLWVIRHGALTRRADEERWAKLRGKEIARKAKEKEREGEVE